jgi:hypothetical protein
MKYCPTASSHQQPLRFLLSPISSTLPWLYTTAKSPIIPDQLKSPDASQSRGLFSTLSALLTRSPGGKPKSTGPESPTPDTHNDNMVARKSVSKSQEPAVEEGEPEVVADEEDEDEDLPDEEYEVDKVLDHRKGAPVSSALLSPCIWLQLTNRASTPVGIAYHKPDIITDG